MLSSPRFGNHGESRKDYNIATMKLSRILSNQNGVSRKQANALVAAGTVTVDGCICRETAWEVDRFSTVACNGRVIQHGDRAHYLMLNKPAGYLSATADKICLLYTSPSPTRPY